MQSVRAFCYGPPPVVDKTSALGCVSYVTSVVLEADCVPRCCAGSLKIAGGLINGISNSLLSHTDDEVRGKLLSILKEASRGLSGPKQIEKELHVAGRVVLMYTNSVGAVSAAQLDGTLSCLRNLEIAPSMFDNNQRGHYAGALSQLLARLPPDDPSWTCLGPAGVSRGGSRSPSGRDQ